MNTSAYGYQPPKKKKKKKDTRIEVDGKPMSKYQKKLMEKEARGEAAADPQASRVKKTEKEEVPSLAAEFKGQFDPAVLEEAELLLQEALASEDTENGPEAAGEYREASESEEKTVFREAAEAGEEYVGAEEPALPGGEAGRQKNGAAARGGKIRPDYRNEACYESFPCSYCGREIRPEGAGSEHRNHCPHCLHSLHVDETPGDRLSKCHGDMEPIGIWVKDGGEWAIVHRCKKCGKLNTNRSLADDNPVALMSLAVKPLANTPFPLRMLEDYLQGKI